MSAAAFQQRQARLAAYLRDPGRAPPPDGIAPERLQVYRELFYNTVEGFLVSAFPVLRALLADGDWHALVRDFYARHRCESPCFHGIAEEFVGYLEQERSPAPQDPPFLAELAHHEWVELALSIAPDPELPEGLDPQGDLLDAAPQRSPLAWLQVYRWPVHQIGPGHVPQEPPAAPTCLLVWRDGQDEVRFMALNLLSARLLQLLETRPQVSGRAQLETLAAELQQPVDALLAQGRALLADWRGRDILLGTRVPTAGTPPAAGRSNPVP